MGLKERRLSQYEMGYGDVIEVPNIVYAEGLVMRLLSPWVTTPCLVLPKGEEDMNLNYLRGQGLLDDGQVRIDRREGKRGKLPESELIPHYECDRIIPLLRGRLNLKRLQELQDKGPASLLDLACITYYEYVQTLHWQLFRMRDWNLTFYHFIERKDPGEYRSRLEEVIRLGVLDWSVEAHLNLFAGRVEVPLLP